MVMSRHRNVVQRLPSLSCPNVMPCHCERVPDHASTERGVGRETTRLKVGRRERSQRAEIGPRGQARRRWLRQLSAIGSGRHQMDAFVRRYIHENLYFRFVMLPDGAAAYVVESAIKNGDWEHGCPLLNPRK